MALQFTTIIYDYVYGFFCHFDFFALNIFNEERTIDLSSRFFVALLFMISHPLTHPNRFFSIHLYLRFYFGCRTALVCSFPAGLVTGLCYLKRVAALGMVGGVEVLGFCSATEPRTERFIHGGGRERERELRHIAYSRSWSEGARKDCIKPPQNTTKPPHQ